jgi:copper type II ascorbate-dependent monooxygenase-like protein
MNTRWLWLLAVVGCASPPSEEQLPPETKWQPLIEADWSIEPGAEDYYCVRKTVEEDVWVRAFDSLSPPGTHHAVLTYGPPDGPDGLVACDSFENHDVMIYGSGVGSRPFAMPDGVAVRIPAGDQLLLNLHLFNATGEMITGSSGVRYEALEDSAGYIEAQAILMGPEELTIPPGDMSVKGTCTLAKDTTLFAVAPHMHQLGRHMTVTAKYDDESEILFDAAYDFEDQQITSLPQQVPLHAGDRIEVRCDYQNNTGNTVVWGESTLAEMCFAGVYRYPRDPNAFFVCFE